VEYVRRNLGIHTADGERVRITFDGNLVVSFVDWHEEPRELTLCDVLAFRWQELDDPAVPRDDETYEVVDSGWLARQAELHAVSAADFAHYMLCFNACGVLDVLCRRLGLDEARSTPSLAGSPPESVRG
jgi:hypothetical protein